MKKEKKKKRINHIVVEDHTDSTISERSSEPGPKFTFKNLIFYW